MAISRSEGFQGARAILKNIKADATYLYDRAGTGEDMQWHGHIMPFQRRLKPWANSLSALRDAPDLLQYARDEFDDPAADFPGDIDTVVFQINALITTINNNLPAEPVVTTDANGETVYLLLTAGQKNGVRTFLPNLIDVIPD